MANCEWPAVGLEAPSASLHAINLKSDLQALGKHVEQNGGALNIPFDTFDSISRSMQSLLDKVLDQPSLHDLMDKMNRIERNTQALLERPTTSVPQANELFDETLATTFPSTPPTLEAESRMMGIPEDLSEQISDLPKATAREILDVQQTTTIQSPEHLGGKLPVDAPFRAGPSSKIHLQIESPEEVNVYEKIYSPLDKANKQIRIVKISSKVDPDFDLRVDFSVVSLKANPVYTALSYTWGDGKDTILIKVNGYRLDVTRNLKRALERLRIFGSSTWFWIDAICINQMDIEERTNQVQLMREIYEKPQEVIVYLGEPFGPNTSMKTQTVLNSHWDAGMFAWTGDEPDMARIEKVLKYVKAYANSYPDLPENRPPNRLLMAICFLRLLAGDVHLKDMPMLNHVHIQKLCLAAFGNLVKQPWVSERCHGSIRSGV
ncbi:hypothetical protein P154DRAFT_498258 [Amniculicola lignicola CBS 123094]|uniref:Heterokaryon incompatibility domain-containing protein n=1 Tax=Amniculicola lignicola CBS 123094 TaxID=1392246 RepID=A0A6A5WBV4_9PLEO|nr:hypothetical protein P154DRAFT_498258 [Amniculicola lignicola CBS 123094]